MKVSAWVGYPVMWLDVHIEGPEEFYISIPHWGLFPYHW